MTLRIGVAVAATLALSALAGADVVLAGPVADNAAQAEQLLSAGKPGDALGAFDRAIDAFWQASPLQFRKIVFADTVSGYGRYAEHQGTTFKAGDTPVIYFEPVGYAFGAGADGAEIGFSAGLEIKTPGGLILAKSSDFADLQWTGASPTHEFYGSLSVALPGNLKPGSYQLILTVTDTVSKKTATATLPFDIGA